MYNETILNKTISLFSVKTEAEEITADSELIDDLDVSSMDILFLIPSLEEEFMIKVPESMLRKMVTIGDEEEIVSGLIK